MAKTLGYHVTLYPAQKEGSFTTIKFELTKKYPQKQLEAAGVPDLIEKVTHFAMEHGEGCSASVRCLAPRNPPGFKNATEKLYYNL